MGQNGARWEPGKSGNKAPHLGQVGVSEKAVSVLSRNEVTSDLSSMLENFELIWDLDFRHCPIRTPNLGPLEMSLFSFAYKIY